jgi:glycerophosphoryl diester phosphodiesterase
MHATESLAMPPVTRLPRPVVIGHRGAPAYRPEHTAASFELAIDMGADLIEPDVVVSRDGVLVVRHESELSLTTDVAEREAFADRRTTRTVNGKEVTGWFTEDFTLTELRALRAVERMPTLRPLNTAYDGRFGILTLAEVIQLARRRSTPARRIEVLIELKTVAWPDGSGPSLAALAAEELRRLGVAHGASPVLVQSFDAGLLRELRARLGENGPRLIQLVDDGAEGDRMVGLAGLREISTYAQGIAPSRRRILQAAGARARVCRLVDEAHRAELSVFCWTLRAENAFLPERRRRGDEPGAHGDAVADAQHLLDLGLDGLITDSPDLAVTALRSRPLQSAVA